MSLILKLVNGMKSDYTNPQATEGKQSVNNVCWYKVKEKLAVCKWSMEYFCSVLRDKIHVIGGSCWNFMDKNNLQYISCLSLLTYKFRKQRQL